MAKAKLSSKVFEYTWQDVSFTKLAFDRAKRTLEFAKLQQNFWGEEVKFWEEHLKMKEFRFTLTK